LRFLTGQIGDEFRTEPLSLDRSFNYQKIERLLNCPAVIFETFIYLVDGDNLWSFHPDDLTTACMDELRIHANLHTFRGKDAIKSMKESFVLVAFALHSPLFVRQRLICQLVK